jgi:hypothetical protein
VRAPSGQTFTPGVTRRRVLAGLLLLPPALASCSIRAADDGPDPLIALADAARNDAALAAAAVAATPDLADRVRPLADARTAHAAALDAEVARADPDRAAVRPTTTPAPPASTVVTLAQVRAATVASSQAAAGAVLTLPVDRVGLVASVAACCAAYAEVLG